MLFDDFKPCFIAPLEFLDSWGKKQAAPDSQAEPANSIKEASGALRQTCLSLLNEAEQIAALKHGPDLALSAKKMAAAWIDEIMLTSGLIDPRVWLGKSLQNEFGLNNQAGEWFYQTLDNLTPTLPDDRKLAAFALRCLALNYKGRWHNRPEELLRLRQAKSKHFGLKSNSVFFPPPLPKVRDMAIVKHIFKAAALMLLFLLILWGAQLYFIVDEITDLNTDDIHYHSQDEAPPNQEIFP